MINMNLSTATRWGLNAAILLSIVLALYLGKSIFIPTIIALLLAAMLWPLATWMNQAGVPAPWFHARGGFPWLRPYLARVRFRWAIACLTVVLFLVAMVLLVGAAFGVGLGRIVVDLGSKKTQEDVYKDFRTKLQKIIGPIREDDEYFNGDPERSKVMESIRGFFSFDSQPFRNAVGQLAFWGGNFLWQSILIMFILLFLLLEGRMLSRRVVEIFGPTPAVQGKAVAALKDMSYQVRNYIVWKTIINFALAGGLGLIYYLAGLKLAWTWALLSAILWYIPYIGAIAAAIPPALDAFVSLPSPWVAVFILCLYTVCLILTGYLVVPLVMGRNMELNATTVMVGCLFWELVWGAPGLFLAMPLMAAVKAVCSHVPDWKPWANLMSSHDEPDEPPPAPAAPTDGRSDETHLGKALTHE